MEAFTTTHRLRFNDTDRLGHVNNAVFAVMLEQGRSELAGLAGLPVESTGQALVIVRLELDFVAEMSWPARSPSRRRWLGWAHGRSRCANACCMAAPCARGRRRCWW